MWSQLLLCALVGFAAASQHGWQDSKEYVYQVRGRTLTGLQDVENQFSGVFMKAKLVIRPESDGNLMAKIVNAKYSPVHTQFPDGWKSQIAESKLNYKNLDLSEKAFQIIMKNGVVSDVIVDSEVHNWQANIIKSFVSQIQLDTQGQNAQKSRHNQLPQEGDNSADFIAMEDTVTGTYATLYDISPLPEHVLQSQPWLVPMPQIKGDGELIEIVKTKNFSRGEERLSYYYGLGGMGDFEPATNQMGDFFLRSSVSRAIVSGSLKHFTIQSSTTTNKIVVAPTLNSEQNGMVVSHLNLTLEEVKPASGSFERPQHQQKLGSLTYTFETPFSGEHNARQGSKRQQQNRWSSSEERVHYRQRRSAANSESSESVESQEQWAQEEAKLNQPPHSPLLPLYIGNKGKNVKTSQKVDAVQAAQKIAKEIAEEIQHPERIQKEQTLAKYVILGSLTRIMDQQEMEQVSQKLYTKQQKGVHAQAWKAWRDAIAECGTGPALLTIQEWIKTEKIQHEEAAEVIASMAQSVRQPTEEYMRTFHELALKEKTVTKQAILNDTAILSYCTLVRKVYVDEEVSHNEFPVHSFGKFRSQQGQNFIVQDLIPELKHKLNEAVENADSHKVLVYIRALGNVAHQKILAVFEPYLEGEKQVSQFQRLQMVIAMDKLVKTECKVAREVLYKIYQNSGEASEVRVAAVYQLMRTVPSATVLQRMAQYTNVDTDEQVNAAVKSSIENAAELEGEEHTELVHNARAAKPLLTTNTYGAQYSQNYLQDYVEEQMNLYYKQTAQTYGSDDSLFPQGLHYALRAGLSGARRELINVQAMVSSIDELTNVLQRQTAKYENDQKQQKQHHDEAQQNQWSSEAIAKLLNIKNAEREQLEGNVLLQIAGGATRFFTFNNQTFDLLPHVVRELESMLKDGQEIEMTKFLNRYEVAISFPTEMAFPFIYTLDAPTLLRVQGQIRASADPKISNGENLRLPHALKGQAELSIVASTRVQAKLGFITPCDHQRYTSGYDKNIQAHLPIKAQIEIDMNEQQLHIVLQPANSHANKNIKLFEYGTYPYTAQHDILELEPVALSHNMKVIKSEQPETEFQTVIGKQAGLALNVDYESDAKFMDLYSIYEQVSRQDAVSALIAPLYSETLQYTKLSVEVDSHKSNNKIQVRAGYTNKYENGKVSGSSPDIQQFAQLPRESKQRQERFVDMALAGTTSANASVVDFSIELEGNNKVEFIATAAMAKSPADAKARVLFYCKKSSANHHESKPFEAAMSAKALFPNTNGLDFNYALKFDPTSVADIDIAFGEEIKSGAKFNVHAKLQQSESRRRFLKNHPRAQECREEMKDGNQHLPACANMTAEANLMDRVQIKINYENVGPKTLNMTKKAYNALRYLAYFNLDENTVDPQGSGKQNQLNLEARFEPDFESVNVTISGQHIESHIKNIRVSNWAKQVVAVHPVFQMSTRLYSEIIDIDTYRPYCVVDQSAANTFDNKTYPLDLGRSWTVMMQYVPTFARDGRHRESYQQQQKDLQTEQFVVLVRDGQSEKEKEVKMTLRAPQTQGKIVEINMKPVQGDCSGDAPCAIVMVNGQQIKYQQEQTKDFHHGYVKVYGLPNGEVKIQVRNNFYIIYDGERVRISTVHDKFRGAVRGLCGTFTGEEYNDFLTPKECILRDPQEFAATYAVDAQGKTKQYQSRAEKSECYDDEVIYANVISDFDAGRSHYKSSHDGHRQNHHNKQSDSSSCTKHQTRYEIQEDDNEICFTIRPLPTCHRSCSPTKMMEKSVQVHCVQRTNVAELWKKQIEKGASPDFSQKSATKTMKMRVPESCVKY